MASQGLEPMAERISFLGIDEDSWQPFFPSLDLERLLSREPPPARLPRPGIRPDRVESAGWAVVLPAGTDPAIRQALAPLLDHRRAQAGDLYRELAYKPRRRAAAFLSELRAGPGLVDPSLVPYYLLLVGGPEQIPFGFEMELALQYAVGRVAFDDVAAYRRFALGVVEREQAVAIQRRSFALLAPTHEVDCAANECLRLLAQPLDSAVRSRCPEVDVDFFAGPEVTRSRLLDTVCRNSSDLVLSAGHASMVVTGDEFRQRQRQGALISADWPGVGTRVLPEYTVAASDLPTDAELAGRIFVFFGCFTGGTPKRDSFDHLLPEERPPLAEKPFVARLPQALLGHPAGGAAAVVGHVDRAWPASFSWQGFANGQAFEDLVLSLLAGQPVGLALEPFRQRFASLATQLAAASHQPGDADEMDPILSKTVWVAYNDARSYIIAGDPAARLS